jgi:hypothetical protein
VGLGAEGRANVDHSTTCAATPGAALAEPTCQAAAPPRRLATSCRLRRQAGNQSRVAMATDLRQDAGGAVQLMHPTAPAVPPTSSAPCRYSRRRRSRATVTTITPMVRSAPSRRAPVASSAAKTARGPASWLNTTVVKAPCGAGCRAHAPAPAVPAVTSTMAAAELRSRAAPFRITHQAARVGSTPKINSQPKSYSSGLGVSTRTRWIPRIQCAPPTSIQFQMPNPSSATPASALVYCPSALRRARHKPHKAMTANTYIST